MKAENIQGQRFTRLVAISFKSKDKHRNAIWVCKCDCGTTKLIRAMHLKSQKTKSCGCLMSELAKERLITRRLQKVLYEHKTN